MTEKENAGILTVLLEEDRERLLGQIRADRSSENAAKVLGKEIDRLAMRFSQKDMQPWKMETAQLMLKTMKSSLPMVETVTDAETWEKTAAEGRKEMTPAGVILLIAGVALVLVPALFHPGILVYAGTGIISITAGGFLLGRKNTRRVPPVQKKQDLYTRYLVDPEAAYRILQQSVITADHCLENLTAPQEFLALTDPVHAGSMTSVPGVPDAAGGQIPMEDTEMLSELLETCYMAKEQDSGRRMAEEQIENIRYYLHGKEIELLDYESGEDEKWFEFLPSGGKKTTIRPALVKNGKLLKKGIASV